MSGGFTLLKSCQLCHQEYVDNSSSGGIEGALIVRPIVSADWLAKCLMEKKACLDGAKL